MTVPYQSSYPSVPGPPQQVQFGLGTAKLNKKFGVLGSAVGIIIGVVLVGCAIWSLAAQSIAPLLIAVGASLIVLLRRLLMPRRTGVIGKGAMGTIAIGTQGIVVSNVQGTANVYAWQEIDAVGVLRHKENIVLRSNSPRLAQTLPRVRPGVPAFLVLSILYIEAPREQVVSALQYYAGARFAGVDLRKDAFN